MRWLRNYVQCVVVLLLEAATRRIVLHTAVSLALRKAGHACVAADIPSPRSNESARLKTQMQVHH